MTLEQIADILVRSVNSSLNGIDSKFEMPFIEALIPGLYARAIQINYTGDRQNAASKRIDGQSILYIDVDYDATIQPAPIIVNGKPQYADYLVFSCPPPISISNKVSGIQYLGSANVTANFCEVYNRADAAQMIQRGFFQGKEIGWCYEGNYVLVWGNKSLKQISVALVPQNPLDISTFNEQTNRYPISENLITGLMTKLFMQDQGLNIQIPPDVILNSNPGNQVVK